MTWVKIILFMRLAIITGNNQFFLKTNNERIIPTINDFRNQIKGNHKKETLKNIINSLKPKYNDVIIMIYISTHAALFSCCPPSQLAQNSTRNSNWLLLPFLLSFTASLISVLLLFWWFILLLLLLSSILAPSEPLFKSSFLFEFPMIIYYSNIRILF